MSTDNRISSTLSGLAGDGNVDIEDVEVALRIARADGKLERDEQVELEAALSAYADRFEGAARRYLEAALKAGSARMPNRVLLAPHPKGVAQRDLFYSRNDVVGLQEALVRVGFSSAVDGDYGPGTVAAVKALQTAAQLPVTGNLDSITLLKLNERLREKGFPLLDISPRAHIRPDYVVALKHGTNTSDNRAIEEGLKRLGLHFNLEALKLTPDGTFDASTEAAVRAFQRMAFLPETGIVDRTTLASLNDALKTVGLAPVLVNPPAYGAGFGGRVELHFYPGDDELKLYVEKEGKVLDIYGMVGGQNRFQDDPRNPHVDYGPSPKGSYEVVEINPQTSGAWPYSYVPYGAHLRELEGEIQFRDSEGVWKWATGPKSAFAGRNPPPLERYAYLEAGGSVKQFWDLNDFGHLRGRLKSLSTGAIQGHMIHSSPTNERTDNYELDTDTLLDAETALEVLMHSHGCEHIHPKDMDELIAKGYLTRGTRFVVHGYDERHPSNR